MPASGDVKHNLLARLRRIEGQTRGLQRMVEEGLYCVTEAIREGKGDEKIHEIMDVVRYYTKA